MKRCLQCEFVYEDDQARCDMDGGELVYEPTLYPAAETAIALVPPSPMKFRSRSFILTAAATVIMGSLLGIGFFGFSALSQSPSSPIPATQPASVQPPVTVQPAMATSSEATPSSEAAPSSDAAPSSEPSPHKSTGTPTANLKARNAAASVSSSAKPAPVASRSPTPRETKPAPSNAKREDDSKVGSLLKKTGRILKKPFRKW